MSSQEEKPSEIKIEVNSLSEDSELDESDESSDDCSEDEEDASVDNDDTNWEGLLHIWERKMKKKIEMLSFVDISLMSLDDSEDDLDEEENVPNKIRKIDKIKCLDMMLPEFCSIKNDGCNMITGDQLVDVVRRKSGDRLDMKVLLLDSINEVSSKSYINLWPLCPKLTVLSLHECTVDDNVLIELSKHVVNLKVLDLYYVRGIEDSSLIEMAKSNRHLGWVNLFGISFSSNGFSNFLMHCGKTIETLFVSEQYLDSLCMDSIARYCKGKILKLIDGGGAFLSSNLPSKAKNIESIKNVMKNCPNVNFENFSSKLLCEAGCKDGYKQIACDKEMKPFLKDIISGPFAVHIEEIHGADEEVIDLLCKSVVVNTLRSLSLPVEMRCISEEAFRKLKVFKNLEHLGCGFALGEFDGLEGPSVSNDAILQVTDAMCNLKSIDFTFSPILPDTIQTIIHNHPSLEKLTLDGCGGELYDYTDFLMKLSEIEELDLVDWTSKNKYGEKSGIYQLEAKQKLAEMGMQINGFI